MFMLPMGDFSALKDLPEQYRHCRDTEDQDRPLLISLPIISSTLTAYLTNMKMVISKNRIVPTSIITKVFRFPLPINTLLTVLQNPDFPNRKNYLQQFPPMIILSSSLLQFFIRP
jgi:hypothetical protein